MKIPKRKATIVYVNNRKEKHGEEQKLACDVKISLKGPPELLDDLDPKLRPNLFNTEEGKDHVPNHPELTHFKWEREFEDSRLMVGEMQFDKTKVNDFTVDIREGGVVTLTFSGHFLIDPEELGPLADYMKSETDIELTTQFDLVDEAQREAA